MWQSHNLLLYACCFPPNPYGISTTTLKNRTVGRTLNGGARRQWWGEASPPSRLNTIRLIGRFPARDADLFSCPVIKRHSSAVTMRSLTIIGRSTPRGLLVKGHMNSQSSSGIYADPATTTNAVQTIIVFVMVVFLSVTHLPRRNLTRLYDASNQALLIPAFAYVTSDANPRCGRPVSDCAS